MNEQTTMCYTVVFDLQGVRCKAAFTTEAQAIDWLKTCIRKGILYPISTIAAPVGSHLLYNQEQLIKMMP